MSSRYARSRALQKDHPPRRSAARPRRSIDAAVRVGFRRNIKLNIVAVKNLVEPDIVPVALYCRARGFEPRYIEFMPLDSQSLWDRNKGSSDSDDDPDLPLILARGVSPLLEIPDRDPQAPATDFAYADGKGKVGFIASRSASRSA